MNRYPMFIGEQEEFDKSQYIILPFPYEFTTTFGKGTKLGPERVLEVSDNLETYDVEIDEEIYLRGIHTLQPLIIDPLTTENDVDRVADRIYGLTKKSKKLITIGGEHTISYPIIKGFSKKYNDFGIIHFDAHTDLRDSYENSKYNHACVLRRISELKIPTVSVGIRATTPEELNFARENNTKIFFAKDTINDFSDIINYLKEFPDKIYITFDVDVLSTSLVKATGTPEPGGYEWYYILSLLKKIFKEKKVLGIDFVEICPDPPYEVSTYTIAKLIYKVIGYWK